MKKVKHVDTEGTEKRRFHRRDAESAEVRGGIFFWYGA
jgi:hypothetical protein